MRRYWRIWVLVLVLCMGCQTEKPSKEGIQLYFTPGVQTHHGAAVMGEPWNGTETPNPEELMQALLKGPTQEGLCSPFPEGVVLLAWRWNKEVPGQLQLVLSEQYSALGGISLTLADYCIVLTLTQLPEVESVEIFTRGAEEYRSHPVLRAEEVELPLLLS